MASTEVDFEWYLVLGKTTPTTPDFSLIALGLAVFASYYAIRRHLNKGNRRHRKSGRKSKGKSRNSFSPKQKWDDSGEEIINYLTNSTNEDSTYHDGVVEGGGAIHLVKSIDSVS